MNAQFKRQDGRAEGVAMYKKNNATTMATPDLIMKLDIQNMVKMFFKLLASESCGDIFAAVSLVN
jgi:hypothetical protein